MVQASPMDVVPCHTVHLDGKAPPQRFYHTSTVIGTKIYVVGGRDAEERYYSEVNVLDTESNNWKGVRIKGNAPKPRCKHSATLLDDKLWVVFGEGQGNSFLNDVFELDTEGGGWRAPEVQGDPPRPRAGHTATAVGGQLWIFGGFNGSGVAETFDELLCLDTHSLTWSQPKLDGAKPCARHGHSAQIIGCRVFFFGGMDSSENLLNDMQVLDLATESWSSYTPSGIAPSPRNFFAAEVCGSQIFYFGGKRLQSPSQDYDMYGSIVGDEIIGKCELHFSVLDTTRNTWYHPVFDADAPALEDASPLGSLTTGGVQLHKQCEGVTTSLLGLRMWIQRGGPTANVVGLDDFACVFELYRALEALPDDGEVVLRVCSMLASLANKSRALQDIITAADFIPLLLDSLQLQHGQPAVQAHICGCLCNLAFNNSTSHSALMAAKTTSLVVASTLKYTNPPKVEEEVEEVKDDKKKDDKHGKKDDKHGKKDDKKKDSKHGKDSKKDDHGKHGKKDDKHGKHDTHEEDEEDKFALPKPKTEMELPCDYILQCAVLQLLYNMASTEASRVSMADEGVIQHTLDAMVKHSNRQDVQALACGVLGNMTIGNKRNKDRVVAGGGLHLIFGILDNHLDPMSLPERQIVMQEVAVDPTDQQPGAETGAAGAGDGAAAADAGAAAAATQALPSADAQPTTMIVETVTNQPEIDEAQESRTEKAKVVSRACFCLWNLCAYHEPNQKLIVDHEGLDRVITMLRNYSTATDLEERKVAEQSIGVIWNLGYLDEFKRAIATKGAVALILNSMRNTMETSLSADLCAVSCAALYNLTAKDAGKDASGLIDNKVLLTRLDGISVIKLAMERWPKSSQVQTEAIGTLLNLSTNMENQTKVRACVPLAIASREHFPALDALQSRVTAFLESVDQGLRQILGDARLGMPVEEFKKYSAVGAPQVNLN